MQYPPTPFFKPAYLKRLWCLKESDIIKNISQQIQYEQYTWIYAIYVNTRMINSYPKGPKQPQTGRLSDLKQNVKTTFINYTSISKQTQYINMTYWVWKMMRFWILQNQQDLWKGHLLASVLWLGWMNSSRDFEFVPPSCHKRNWIHYLNGMHLVAQKIVVSDYTLKVGVEWCQ